MRFKVVAVILILTLSCNEKYTPKPRGFFRIDFPEKKYHIISNEYPYQFEIADYTSIKQDPRNPNKKYWINITIPQNQAEIHLSYYGLGGTENSDNYRLAEFIEESRTLAYKHTIKASAIQERIYVNPANHVYGTIYDIAGNAASPMQFFLTDSTNHFLRGALYIRATPNVDSLRPVIEFLETDIVRLIETTNWN
jgi:gliding motility-associated lipoprotein GldD